MKYVCSFCYKEYQQKINYDYHVPLCRITNNNNKNNNIEKNENLSNLDIQIVIKKILKKNEELENRIKKLENEKVKILKNNDKIINKKMFLNDKIKLDTNFIDFIEKLKLDNIILEYLFDNNLHKTYDYIIKKIDTEDYSVPIKTFKNDSKIYIFDREWIVIDYNYYNKLILKIHQKLIGLFIEWKKINIEKINNDDNLAIIAEKNQMKICCNGKNINELLTSNNINKMFKKVDFQEFYINLTCRE